MLITDGGFLKDGTFRHMLHWDTDNLEELFRAVIFRLLIEKDLIGLVEQIHSPIRRFTADGPTILGRCTSCPVRSAPRTLIDHALGRGFRKAPPRGPMTWGRPRWRRVFVN